MTALLPSLNSSVLRNDLILGPVFHRYSDGYRFAMPACELVEKHGFIAYQAKVYHAMGLVYRLVNNGNVIIICETVH
jgi:hypothetical protein